MEREEIFIRAVPGILSTEFDRYGTSDGNDTIVVSSSIHVSTSIIGFIIKLS